MEEEKIHILDVLQSNSSQIWYREHESGKKDKIERNIFVCQTEEDLLKTECFYTKEAYASPMIMTDSPIAGERSWIPQDNRRVDTDVIMFVQNNVFIRLYINLQGEIDPHQLTVKLAKRLENIIKDETVIIDM